MLMQEIRSFFGLFFNFGYDMTRYWRYAFNYRKRDMDQHIARIWIATHSIEKGLSMPSPRMGFGKDVVEDLVALLLHYKSRHFDEDQVAIWSALGALEQYLLTHNSNHYVLGELEEKIKNVLISYDLPRTGGIKQLCRTDIQKAAKGDFSQLVASRHSIRQFAPEPVDMAIIQEAIRLAQRTPSVCNRQSWRVYICMDRQKIARLAQLQGSCAGFGETASFFIIVASDLSSFAGSSERKQAYIDGGLFSMSLIYALHYLGLAVCPLNWCKNCFLDSRLRKEFALKDSEDIITMLAVGNMYNEFNVARSGRGQLDKIIRTI